jgi:hypothetical protein
MKSLRCLLGLHCLHNGKRVKVTHFHNYDKKQLFTWIEEKIEWTCCRCGKKILKDDVIESPFF